MNPQSATRTVARHTLSQLVATGGADAVASAFPDMLTANVALVLQRMAVMTAEGTEFDGLVAAATTMLAWTPAPPPSSAPPGWVLDPAHPVMETYWDNRGVGGWLWQNVPVTLDISPGVVYRGVSQVISVTLNMDHPAVPADSAIGAAGLGTSWAYSPAVGATDTPMGSFANIAPSNENVLPLTKSYTVPSNAPFGHIELIVSRYNGEPNTGDSEDRTTFRHKWYPEGHPLRP